MKRTIASHTLLIGLAAALSWRTAVGAQDGRGALEAAAKALGTTELTSIQITGRGSDFLFGQSHDGASPWPRFNLPRYSLTIDFATAALRDERTRTQAQNPPLGGGNQPINEQRQVWALSGQVAWNGDGRNGAPAGDERDQRTSVEDDNADLADAARIHQAALAANATVTPTTIRGAKKTLVSFTAPNHAGFEGVLNDEHLVERIQTWLGSPVLGDTLLEAVFSDYKDFGGVVFPTHVVQREGGYPILDVTITDAKKNVAASIEVPSNTRPGRSTGDLQAQKLSDGVWSIPLGSRDRSVAIEFLDHLVVVEAPDSEEISNAAIELIKKTIPNKPIRYVINTHTHFDHSGGLRTYAAEGAIVVTHVDNIPYYQQVWANPRTIHPDRLAKSQGRPVFEGIVGSRTFADRSREMVVYHYAGNMHNAGMLMVFLPKEKSSSKPTRSILRTMRMDRRPPFPTSCSSSAPWIGWRSMWSNWCRFTDGSRHLRKLARRPRSMAPVSSGVMSPANRSANKERASQETTLREVDRRGGWNVGLAAVVCRRRGTGSADAKIRVSRSHGRRKA